MFVSLNFFSQISAVLLCDSLSLFRKLDTHGQSQLSIGCGEGLHEIKKSPVIISIEDLISDRMLFRSIGIVVKDGVDISEKSEGTRDGSFHHELVGSLSSPVFAMPPLGSLH